MSGWIIFAVVVVASVLYASNADAQSSTDGSTAPLLTGSLYNGVDAFTAAWARAIAPAENVNPAYNDPGGLNLSGDLGSTPAKGGGVIGIFSSIDAGYDKLQSILTSYVNNHGDLTLLQATSRYITGQAGNGDPSTYPANVLNEAYKVGDGLGADVNETLSSLAGNS